jgi:hypothetical protein
VAASGLSGRTVIVSVGDVGEQDVHKVDGPRMQVDSDGTRYWVRCSCGWSSEPSLTGVLAEAAGEQHRTLVRVRRQSRP